MMPSLHHAISFVLFGHLEEVGHPLDRDRRGNGGGRNWQN